MSFNNLNAPLSLYWIAIALMTAASLLTNRTQWYWRLPVAFLGFVAGSLLFIGGGYGGIWALFIGFLGIFLGFVKIVHASRGAGRGIRILGITNIFLGLALILGSLLGATSSIITLAIGVIIIVLGLVSVRAAMRRQPGPS